MLLPVLRQRRKNYAAKMCNKNKYIAHLAKRMMCIFKFIGIPLYLSRAIFVLKVLNAIQN